MIGVADENDLIKPKAYVVLKARDQAGPATIDTLQEHVKAQLAPYKYPRWIEFVPELPKTATGKIQRFKLRQQATAIRHAGRIVNSQGGKKQCHPTRLAWRSAGAAC